MAVPVSMSAVAPSPEPEPSISPVTNDSDRGGNSGVRDENNTDKGKDKDTSSKEGKEKEGDKESSTDSKEDTKKDREEEKESDTSSNDEKKKDGDKERDTGSKKEEKKGKDKETEKYDGKKKEHYDNKKSEMKSKKEDQGKRGESDKGDTVENYLVGSSTAREEESVFSRNKVWVVITAVCLAFVLGVIMCVACKKLKKAEVEDQHEEETASYVASRNNRENNVGEAMSPEGSSIVVGGRSGAESKDEQEGNGSGELMAELMAVEIVGHSRDEQECDHTV